MTTDEAREELNKMYEAMWILISFKDQIESIDTTFVNNRRLVEALEVSIEALQQPDGQSLLQKVRKYLKETPREQVLADWDATSPIEGGIMVDEYLASLQPALVYHYLPEVPEDGEVVIGYIDGFDRGMIMGYRSDWFNSFIWNAPYAWTRIPPKPPIKPTEEQP